MTEQERQPDFVPGFNSANIAEANSGFNSANLAADSAAALPPEGEEPQAQAIIGALRHRQGATAKLAELEAELRASLRFDERKRLAALREPLLEERKQLERKRQEQRRRLEQQRGLEWASHLEERRRLDERQQAEVAERRRILRFLLEERRRALTPDFGGEDYAQPAAEVLSKLQPQIQEELQEELNSNTAREAQEEQLARNLAALRELVAAASRSFEPKPRETAQEDIQSEDIIPEDTIIEDNISEDTIIENNIKEAARENNNNIEENNFQDADTAAPAEIIPAYDPQLAQNIADALGIEVVPDEPESSPPQAEPAEAEPEQEPEEEIPAAAEPEADWEQAEAMAADFGAYLADQEEEPEDKPEDNPEDKPENNLEDNPEAGLGIGAALEADAAARLTHDEVEGELFGDMERLRASILREDPRKTSLPPNTLLPLLFLAVIFVMGFCTYGLHFKVFLREAARLDFGAQPVWESAEQLIERWEADGAEYLAWKEPLVALDGLAARAFDKRFVRDTDYSYSIIRDNHGWLQFITFDAKPREIVRRIGEYQALEVPILYVQPPTKFIEGYTEFPPTLHDKTAANVTQNLGLLAAAGVPYLDLRQAAAADGLDKEQMFYRTDHHWRVETAFWAAGRTVAEVEELLGWQLDPEGFYTDPANWQATEYRQNFLGSQGRRVGRFYGGLDDFTLLTPGFETRFRLERKQHTGQLEVSQGSFEEVILDASLLEAESVYTNRYGAYWGADYPTVLADNLLIGDEGLTVMIIKDSYSLPYGAFLATMVDKLYMVDLRYFAIEGLADYIRDVQPDLILIMYS